MLQAVPGAFRRKKVSAQGFILLFLICSFNKDRIKVYLLHPRDYACVTVDKDHVLFVSTHHQQYPW